MNLGLQSVVGLESLCKVVALHPSEERVFHGVGSRVVVVDARNETVVATLEVPRQERVDLLLLSPSHPRLVVMTRLESVYVYSTDDYSLIASLVASAKSSDGDGNGFAAACVSAVHPYVFFSRSSSKQIYMLDLMAAQRGTTSGGGKFDGKKPVTSLAAHPSKPLFASGHADGSVRLWDYQLGSCRVSEEYNVFAQNSAKLTPSPFGITTLALSFDHVVAASPIGLAIALRASGKGLTMLAARVLNATRGLTSMGVLTCIAFHPKQEFFISCFSLGKIQSWRLSNGGSNTPSSWSIIRSGDITPSDYMSLLTSAYRARDIPLPLSLRDFVVRSVVVHPRNFMVAFGLEYANTDDATEALSSPPPVPLLHPVFLLSSATNPQLPSLPTSAVFHVPFGGLSMPSSLHPSLLYYVKRGQLIGFSLQSNENIILRQIPGVGPTIQTVRVEVGAGPFLLVMIESVDTGAASGGSSALTVKKKSRAAATSASLGGLGCRTSACLVAKNGSSLEKMEARDALFLGKDRYVLLSEDGLSLLLVSSLTGTRTTVELGQASWDRIFPSMQASELMYFSNSLGLLCFAAPVTRLPETASHCFHTHRREQVVQVAWQTALNTAFILTNQRLVLVDDHLQMIHEIECPVNSALWMDSVVLFSRRDTCTIDYLCVDGYSRSLVSTTDSNVQLCAAFPKQVIFVCPSLSDTQITSVAIWPFAALVRGVLAAGGPEMDKNLSQLFSSSLDFYSGATPDFVLLLKDAGYPHLAARILANAPQLYTRMCKDGRWTDEAAVSAAIVLESRESGPDLIDAWFPQKLDFYRGAPSPLEYGMTSEVGHAASSDSPDDTSALPAPPGFVPVVITALKLPSLSCSTRSSSYPSSDFLRKSSAHLDLVKVPSPVAASSLSNNRVGTPVFSVRKPAPQVALPSIPPSPTASQAITSPITLHPSSDEEDREDDRVDDDEEDEEDQSDVEVSPTRGSPVLGRQQSILLQSNDGWGEAALPFKPRESQMGETLLVLGELGEEIADEQDRNSFADIMHSMSASGKAPDDAILVAQARQYAEETIALYELNLLGEALNQATEALATFAKVTSSSDHLEWIRRTACYKMLVIISLRVAAKQEEDRLSPKVTLAWTLAASLPYLDPDHRRPLVLKAVNLNTEAGNFRVAQRLAELHGSIFEASRFQQVLRASGEGKAVDAQAWCEYFEDKIVFTTDKILTSKDQFMTCSQCMCSSLGMHKVCQICGYGSDKK